MVIALLSLPALQPAMANEPVTVQASEGAAKPAPDVDALRKSADRGDPAAQVQLGEIYVEGESVPADETQAAKLFRKAADRGNANAQYDLGLLYIRGAGVPKDFVEAYKWLTLSADAGRQGSLNPRDGIAGEMTPEQLDRARELARSWKPLKRGVAYAKPTSEKSAPAQTQ
jgi:hypothetical protein